jgi:hypothetical protein
MCFDAARTVWVSPALGEGRDQPNLRRAGPTALLCCIHRAEWAGDKKSQPGRAGLARIRQSEDASRQTIVYIEQEPATIENALTFRAGWLLEAVADAAPGSAGVVAVVPAVAEAEALCGAIVPVICTMCPT